VGLSCDVGAVKLRGPSWTPPSVADPGATEPKGRRSRAWTAENGVGVLEDEVASPLNNRSRLWERSGARPLQGFMNFYAPIYGGVTKWWAVSVCASVCLSVACLDLNHERKGLGSPKFTWWKPWKPWPLTFWPLNRFTPWTYLEVKRSRSRSSSRLMLSQTLRHTQFGGIPRDAKVKVKSYSIK